LDVYPNGGAGGRIRLVDIYPGTPEKATYYVAEGGTNEHFSLYLKFDPGPGAFYVFETQGQMYDQGGNRFFGDQTITHRFWNGPPAVVGQVHLGIIPPTGTDWTR